MNIDEITCACIIMALIIALVSLIVVCNTYLQLRDIGSTFTLMELEVDSKLKAITEKLDAEIFKKSKELSKSSSYSTIYIKNIYFLTKAKTEIESKRKAGNINAYESDI